MSYPYVTILFRLYNIKQHVFAQYIYFSLFSYSTKETRFLISVLLSHDINQICVDIIGNDISCILPQIVYYTISNSFVTIPFHL